MQYALLISLVILSIIFIVVGGKYMRYKSRSNIKENYLNSLLSHFDNLAAITDCDGIIQATSPNFNKLFSVNNAEEKLPKKIIEIVPIKSNFNYKNIFDYLFKENKPIKNLKLMVRSNEIDRQILLSVYPVLNANNIAQGYLHIFEKEDPGRSINPDFSHIEKLTNIGKIATGMAHELNTPLGAIMLSADHIKQSETNHDIIEEASKIKNRAEHCSKVVKELLGYVRKVEEKQSVYNIKDIIIKVQRMITSEIVKKNINVDFSSSFNECFIKGNENQVEQLFFNLFSNACYALEDNGEIKIRITDDPIMNQILIEFSDNGKGIREENLDKIFEPFFTTKPGSEGTGLGLALCKKIILAHGGRIDVNSNVGEGTTFLIHFPAVK